MITLRLARPVSRLPLSRLSARISGLAAVARSRQSLKRLDDHLLRDIGLTKSEADAEADRAPWDAPSHWRG